MRRHARRAAPLAGVAGLAAMVALALPARAAAPTSAGWWWQGNGGIVPAPLPPPPGVPDGGMFVAADPGGSRAIAAVRFELREGARASTLVLHAADVTGPAAMAACPVNASWQPAAGGAWADRPSYDCGAAVAGVADAAGSTFTFEVGSLARDGAVDVAIVPAAESPAGAGSPGAFQVTFDKPGADALAVTGGDVPDTGAGNAGPLTEGAVPPVFTGAGTGGGSAPAGASGFTATGPGVALAESGIAPATAAAGPGVDQQSAPPPAAATDRAGVASSAALAATGRPGGLEHGALRATAAVVLALVMVGYVVLSRTPAGIGGDRSTIGGLGRFRRARTPGSEAPPL